MTENVDRGKRQLLLAATTAAGGVAAASVATPFVMSLMPSERAKAAGAPVEVDISGIAPGTMKVVEWQGKPVWIVRRTKEMLDWLPKHDSELTDPTASVPQQPEYCDNATRSIKPDVFVVIGICTHLGCSRTSARKRRLSISAPTGKGAGYVRATVRVSIWRVASTRVHQRRPI